MKKTEVFGDPLKSQCGGVWGALAGLSSTPSWAPPGRDTLRVWPRPRSAGPEERVCGWGTGGAPRACPCVLAGSPGLQAASSSEHFEKPCFPAQRAWP